MDEFTREMARLAYDTLYARRRGKSKPIAPQELAAQIERQWFVYRNGVVAQEAARILGRARPQRLAELVDSLWDQLALFGERWEYPDWDYDDPQTVDEPGPCCPLDHDALLVCARWSADAIAALRWLHRDQHGRAPRPQYTLGDLADWLAGVQTVQLTLGI
ncbi:MAG: hypothetical protein KKA73_07895 [Chloroflexi bacterium]|nr:hypothetical protein [Chloroflexota bacterium]MBU1747595.1 hypothetical protein [Chloroflexota bacterium]